MASPEAEETSASMPNHATKHSSTESPRGERMDRQRTRRGARRLRACTRTIAVGIVSLSMVGGATLALAGRAATAGADGTPFANGNAVAQASVLRIAPG